MEAATPCYTHPHSPNIILVKSSYSGGDFGSNPGLGVLSFLLGTFLVCFSNGFEDLRKHGTRVGGGVSSSEYLLVVSKEWRTGILRTTMIYYRNPFPTDYPEEEAAEPQTLRPARQSTGSQRLRQPAWRPEARQKPRARLLPGPSADEGSWSYDDCAGIVLLEQH